MDIRSLKYFLCIADCRGVTAAAKKLNMTQPPLSNQLKALEAELGFPLFYRKNKAFLLTKEGRLLYERGKEIVSDFDNLLDSFSDIRSGTTGELRVGATTTFSLIFLPSLIRSFTAKNPAIKVHLQESSSRVLMDLLTNDELDIGILKSSEKRPGFQYLNIDALTGNTVDGEMYIVGRKDYFSGRSDSISLKELGDMPIFVHNVQQKYLLDACRLQNVYPHLIGTNANVVTSLIWCINGLGVSILSKSSLRVANMLEGRHNLTAIRLAGYKSFEQSDYIVCREGTLKRPVRLFLNEAKHLSAQASGSGK